MVSWELVTSELPRHRHHGTQTCGREGKTSVLLRQVGLIADSTDERADLEHMLGFPTRSVKFNGPFTTQVRLHEDGLSVNGCPVMIAPVRLTTRLKSLSRQKIPVFDSVSGIRYNPSMFSLMEVIASEEVLEQAFA